MQTLRWHKWEDGIFPELERLDYEVVGLFHAIRAHYWRTGKIVMSKDMADRILGRNPTTDAWNTLEESGLLERLCEYLGEQQNSDLSEKRRAAARSRWDKAAMQMQCKPDASAMQVAMQSQIQSQTQTKKEKEKDSCTVPPADTVLMFPCTGTSGKECPITQRNVDSWKQAFPGVNVDQALRSMKAWLEANPSRRKTANGIPAFVVRWLTKEQDKGSPPPRDEPYRGRAPESQQKFLQDLENYQIPVMGRYDE